MSTLLRWLIYLARRLVGVPLALVLSTRQAEAGPVQGLLDELLLIPDVAVLQPGGLSERAIAMLAVQRLAAEPDPSFVTACRQATGGNPFLLAELFGELHRRRIMPSRENAALASQLSSQGVGRAVRARLRCLEPSCTALARAVAVLGDPAEPDLTGRLAGLDEHMTARAADLLTEAVIFEPGRLAVIHPLVRASVYADLNSHERARQHGHAAQLLARAGKAPDRVAVHGAALRTMGLVEPGDSGIALLEEAVACLEPSHSRMEHALALLDLGAALRRAGRRADARGPLSEALGIARACGADAIAVRAHDELVTAGARPRRDPIQSRSNLTASELRVARLAAEGITNRQIAQALFLTENTIETHLRSVFRKLDTQSRSQLARAL